MQPPYSSGSPAAKFLANSKGSLPNRTARYPSREDRPSSEPGSLRARILELVPNLRAFAISLTGQLDRADDLVQETLVKALGNLDKFNPDTNLQAWLFTILRNQFHTNYRKIKREVEDPDGVHASTLATPPSQEIQLHLQDIQAALLQLPVEQREALLLTSLEGLSYEEAALVCKTQIGTIKSRINRARTRLTELLGDE